MAQPHNPRKSSLPSPPAEQSPIFSASDPGYRLVIPARRSPNVAQAVLLAGTVAQLAIALLITVYLARGLSPSAFGFFSLVGSIFILARKFLDLGLSNVASREITRDPQRERPILEGLMAYRRAAGLVLALALMVFAVFQKGQIERDILIAVGVVLLFTEPAALDPVFQVRQAQGGPALLNILGGMLVLGGSVVLMRLNVAGPSFAWLLIVREGFVLLFTMLLADRLLGYRPKPGFRGRALREFIAPALIFGLASLIYTIYFHCDVFFVYALRGKEELGAYAAAYRPINPLLLLPWLLMVPMIPVLTASAAGDRDKFVRQVRGACGLALGLGSCAFVAGVLLAPELVQLLYRGRYLYGALSCVNAFRWLAVALAQVCVTTVLAASLLAHGKEKLLLAIGASAFVVNAAFNLVALHYYNFTAAGFATALTELLYLVCALVAFRLVSGYSALTWESLVYLLPAIAMGTILKFVGGGPAMKVGCGIVLGGLAAAAILFSSGARRFRAEMTGSSPAF
ncbi:MAG: oligosaccharide flippase family protein [Candidatus Korobacteraceae bacterium]